MAVVDEELAGLALKRPVVAASCRECPWGAIADVLKEMIAPTGHDLRVCYTCSMANNPRIVAGDVAPPPTDRRGSPPPPKGPIDFGISAAARVQWAYKGVFDYEEEGPRRSLRHVAFIEHPGYHLIAAKKSLGIKDLGEIAKRKMKVKVMTPNDALTRPVLEYYGITKDKVESWGGAFVSQEPSGCDDFDVIVYRNVHLCNIPETRGFYRVTIEHELVYFDMPDDLRKQIADRFELKLVNLPRALFRGVDRPIKTVGRSGTVVYARDDTPDDFAYLLAKSIDEQRDMLLWTNMPLSVDPRTVAHLPGVPLHPGAERYYKEVGYL
jgi:TRAP-type uncharacterized transport system substrate-binding protein